MNDERGTAVLEMSLGIALFLIPVALLVITISTWPERQTVARAAAVEAARIAVLSDSWGDAAAAGEEAVSRAATNYGLHPSDLSLSWDGHLARGSAVTARVTVRIPSVVLPGLTTVGAWSRTASHTERVDTYRSMP
jgi:hypothetical protein